MIAFPLSAGENKGKYMVDRRSLLDVLTKRERALVRKGSIPKHPEVMLATLTDRRFSNPDWIFERKLDGERVLVVIRDGRIELLSRNHNSLNNSYPEIVGALARQELDDCLLDGEIVAFEGNLTSFSKLQQRMKINDPDLARNSDVSVKYYLFDCMAVGSASFDELPLTARKKLLKAFVQFRDPLRYVQHRNEQGEAFYRKACETGWEGIIAKRANSRYVHGRSKDWLKFKCDHGQEFVIGGFTDPKGDRKGFGSLLIGYYQKEKLIYAGKVGTGFDDAMLEDLGRRMKSLAIDQNPFSDFGATEGVHFIEPELVCEVKFTEWTEHGKLRHPRFVGMRRDKKAAAVVRESDAK
jgi:bifunctional non-homologous end joining protein LigD